MKNLMRSLVLFIGTGIVYIVTAIEQQHASVWTRTYQQKFSSRDEDRLKDRDTVVFEKETSFPFKQLIFSWNAHRPNKGFFSFLVQARDARTKQWGVWHPMIDWGHTVQRSYEHKPDSGHTTYHYVRLESKPGISKDTFRLSDTFRVKVVAHAGAQLTDLKMISVSIADFKKFKEETVKDLLALRSIHIAGVPSYSQMCIEHPRAMGMCSPTSCAMLVGFLMQHAVDTRQFALGVYDEGFDIYGTWPFNTAHMYEYCKGNVWFKVVRLHSFKDIHTRLMSNLPVIVSIVGPLPGASTSYSGGHLLMVVGYDAKTQEVVCHDPAFDTHERVLHRYPLADFLHAWHKRYRLAYIAEPM